MRLPTRCSFSAHGLVVVACVVGLGTTAHAQTTTLDGTFTEANAAYARGDYEVAAVAYERLVEAGVEDADVFYDLGLAHARRGAHGRAIAAFERSLRVRPGDAEVLSALEASRGTLGRRRADREGEALVESGAPTLGSLFGWASEDLLSILVLLFEALLILSLIGLFFTKAERGRIALGVTAPVAALLLAATAVGLVARTGAMDPGPSAIVVREGAPMREGPSSDASERHEALEGERVYVTGRDGAFLRIEAGTRVGWIAESDVVQL